MRIKAMILDDEQHCRDGLSALLERRHPEVELVGMATNVPEGIDLVGKTTPDLLFLDVEMPPRTGFELLQALGPRMPHVVFTTAHESYALKAIRFSAMDFLLKPIDSEELARAIGKVQEALRRPQRPEGMLALLNNVAPDPDGRIAFPARDGIALLTPDEVRYLTHSGDGIEVHRISGELLHLDRTMKECEEILAENGFIRVQRIHLINPKHVREYTFGSVIMDDGQRIPVDKRKDQDVQQALSAL